MELESYYIVHSLGVLAAALIVYAIVCRRPHGDVPTEAKAFTQIGATMEPVSANFDWESTEPRKYRPFKPRPSLTMGISRPSPEDWLLIENTYLDRINHHKTIFRSVDREATGLCNPKADLAVSELYDAAVQFVQARFPQYFQKRGAPEKLCVIDNNILGTTLPASSSEAMQSGMSTRDLLRALGEHLEEDFLLLGFDPAVGEYRLEACTGIAANGFLWKSRMGKKLTHLHGPVPQYKERLQFSMNKFFQKLKPHEAVQRFTYKVQLSRHDQVFLPEGNASPNISTDFARDVHMRLERQQLTRLPKSGFILFTIRTYMYPIKDIKDEGLGEAMAESIRSWPHDFAQYKHRDDWGVSTLRYLEAKS